MTDDPNEPRPDDAAEPAQNPEGEPRVGASSDESDVAGGVSGDEAEAAGARATADEAVSRQEIIEESAYQDDSADVGPQAAEAERHDKE